MTQYVDEKDVNDLLNEAEKILTEIVGRYQAQRMIGLFLDLDMKGFNLYQKIYDKGKAKAATET